MAVGDLYFNTETVCVILTPPSEYWGSKNTDKHPRLRYISSKTSFLELTPFLCGTRRFIILASKNASENCWMGPHELHYLMELGKNGWGIEDEG